MSPRRPYWVTYTGTIGDESGPVDPKDPRLSRFLLALTRGLLSHDVAHSPAVLTYGDGEIVLSTVVQAPSEGTALDFAKAAFAESITIAGGSSTFPEHEHPCWEVARLLRYATVQEVDPSQEPSRPSEPSVA